MAHDPGLALSGIMPMMFTGRLIPGMVDVADLCVQDEAVLGPLPALGLATVRALPPKVAKPRKG